MTNKRHKILAGLIVAALSFPALLLAEEPTTTSEPQTPEVIQTSKKSEEKLVTEKRIRLNSGFGYSSFTFLDESVSGPLIVIGLDFGITKKLAAILGFRQGFSSFSFSPGYSAIDFGIKYAILGKTIRETRALSIGRDKVVETTEQNTSGVFVSLFLNQYFISQTAGALPYAGGGLQLEYEYPYSNVMNIGVGGRYDMCMNSRATFTPIQFFLGIKLWL